MKSSNEKKQGTTLKKKESSGTEIPTIPLCDPASDVVCHTPTRKWSESVLRRCRGSGSSSLIRRGRSPKGALLKIIPPSLGSSSWLSDKLATDSRIRTDRRTDMLKHDWPSSLPWRSSAASVSYFNKLTQYLAFKLKYHTVKLLQHYSSTTLLCLGMWNKKTTFKIWEITIIAKDCLLWLWVYQLWPTVGLAWCSTAISWLDAATTIL